MKGSKPLVMKGEGRSNGKTEQEPQTNIASDIEQVRKNVRHVRECICTEATCEVTAPAHRPPSPLAQHHHLLLVSLRHLEVSLAPSPHPASTTASPSTTARASPPLSISTAASSRLPQSVHSLLLLHVCCLHHCLASASPHGPPSPSASGSTCTMPHDDDKAHTMKHMCARSC